MDKVTEHLNEISREQIKAVNLIREALEALTVSHNKLIKEQQTAITLIGETLDRLEIAQNKLKNVMTLAENWRNFAEGDGMNISGDNIRD